MSSKIWLSRRNVLRGLGVSLSLPWLESLSSSSSKALAQSTETPQVVRPVKRYLLMYMPCGVATAFWSPQGQGAGDAWKLSALLEPLMPYKQYLQVLSNVGQEALYNEGTNSNPSHSRYCAPTFSCTVPDTKAAILGGPTTDQIISAYVAPEHTPVFSVGLPVGCSTMNSNPDGRHPSISRSISWKKSNEPLYKEVNPQAVFDKLMVGYTPAGEVAPEAQAAAQLVKDRNLSVLDYVLDEANSLHGKLSASDRIRFDQFLGSVRQTEAQARLVGTSMPGGTTKVYTRPTLSAKYNDMRRPGTPVEGEGTYNRNDHAEVMNDLIAMAFEMNKTSVVTHMLDDARSEYHYNFLKERSFTQGSLTSVETATGVQSADQQGDLLGYHGLSHAGDNNNGFATVNHWFVQKLASLLGRMAAPTQADGKSLLDDTVILFMSGMRGSSHELVKLPVVLASNSPVFKKDQHHVFSGQMPLANLHLTLLQNGFGIDANVLASQAMTDQIGTVDPKLRYGTGIIDALLA
jgi:hypothetical protein